MGLRGVFQSLAEQVVVNADGSGDVNMTASLTSRCTVDGRTDGQAQASPPVSSPGHDLSREFPFIT